MEPMDTDQKPVLTPLTQAAVAALSATPPAIDTSNNSPSQHSPASGSAPIKRRSPIACRRCRRMRSKCIHDKATPPCKACNEAGLGAEECVFPLRGQADHDRDYRHPRMRAEKINKRDPAKIRREILDAPIVKPPIPVVSRTLKGVDEWDQLPPVPNIIEGVIKFTKVYFQLGFIPKELFVQRLQTDPRSISVFWLMSLLSTAARWTPSLVERYGKGVGVNAAEYFMERASQLVVHEVYKGPSLERLQGFYLLSIAQQGSAEAHKSYINLGIAIRMASLMQLHREESYLLLPEYNTQERRITLESARRTLWMLYSQDNLHSGPRSPVSLGAGDITTLLPCTEEQFALGVEPDQRAALEDTPPGQAQPELCEGPRSLFASLMQVHHYWGLISRRVVARNKSSRPWEPDSDYARMATRLRNWETNLPNEHTWSVYLLTGHKAAGQDLAYLGVTMVTRLCNIVLRRAYLQDMIYPDRESPEHHEFFSEMAGELFCDVRNMYEQIDTQFRERQPDESVGAQMASFCVYSCALLAVYLQKFPKACPDPNIAREGPTMFQRTIAILEESKKTWPLALRWLDGLRKFSGNTNAGIQEGTMADGKEPMPNALGKASMEKRSILQTPPTNPQQLPQHQNGESFVEPLRLPAPIQGAPRQHPPMPHGQPHPHAQSPCLGQAHPSRAQNVPGQSRGPRTNGLGLLLEAFDTQGPNQPRVHSQHQTGSVIPDSFCVPMPGSSAQPMPLNPATDGYDTELQIYSSWNNVNQNVNAVSSGPIYTGY
ncbi:hypothetical protein MKZ38_009449 [Zalerion maritima]|uniref:Zn(2)-C6 fungal-type domain-containing protein n=1 Tax=Zalerion maritima TaxID=339359 RepID=A0AAD5WUP3_9PEZI|nr:hypothetical protein MKZ38_009449 [Zalerion maritima]